MIDGYGDEDDNDDWWWLIKEDYRQVSNIRRTLVGN